MKCNTACRGTDLQDALGHTLLAHRTGTALAKADITTVAELRLYATVWPDPPELMWIRDIGAKSGQLIADTFGYPVDGPLGPPIELVCPACHRKAMAIFFPTEPGVCTYKPGYGCLRYWKDITPEYIKPRTDSQ